MTTPNAEWVERVRFAATGPLHSSAQAGSSRNWAVGDALLLVPEEQRDAVAEAAGLDKSNARSYWKTSQAWTPGTRRTDVSWSVHRNLSRFPNRQEIIRPGIKVREAHSAVGGKQIDRKAVHRLTDEDLIDEIVRLMLSPRSTSLVSEIVARLNLSKEGRRAARDKRSTTALRRLEEEIRSVQKEIRKRRDSKSPRLRFLEVRRRLLDTEVNVEEIGLLVNDPDDRRATDEEDWRDLAERVGQLRDTADRVATEILDRFDVLDAEAWTAHDEVWTVKELSAGGSGEIVDADIVEMD